MANGNGIPQFGTPNILGDIPLPSAAPAFQSMSDMFSSISDQMQKAYTGIVTPLERTAGAEVALTKGGAFTSAPELTPGSVAFNQMGQQISRLTMSTQAAVDNQNNLNTVVSKGLSANSPAELQSLNQASIQGAEQSASPENKAYALLYGSRSSAQSGGQLARMMRSYYQMQGLSMYNQNRNQNLNQIGVAAAAAKGDETSASYQAGVQLTANAVSSAQMSTLSGNNVSTATRDVASANFTLRSGLIAGQYSNAQQNVAQQEENNIAIGKEPDDGVIRTDQQILDKVNTDPELTKWALPNQVNAYRTSLTTGKGALEFHTGNYLPGVAKIAAQNAIKTAHTTGNIDQNSMDTVLKNDPNSFPTFAHNLYLAKQSYDTAQPFMEGSISQMQTAVNKLTTGSSSFDTADKASGMSQADMIAKNKSAAQFLKVQLTQAQKDPAGFFKNTQGWNTIQNQEINKIQDPQGQQTLSGNMTAPQMNSDGSPAVLGPNDSANLSNTMGKLMDFETTKGIEPSKVQVYDAPTMSRLSAIENTRTNAQVVQDLETYKANLGAGYLPFARSLAQYGLKVAPFLAVAAQEANNHSLATDIQALGPMSDKQLSAGNPNVGKTRSKVFNSLGPWLSSQFSDPSQPASDITSKNGEFVNEVTRLSLFYQLRNMNVSDSVAKAVGAIEGNSTLLGGQRYPKTVTVRVPDANGNESLQTITLPTADNLKEGFDAVKTSFANSVDTNVENSDLSPSDKARVRAANQVSFQNSNWTTDSDTGGMTLRYPDGTTVMSRQGNQLVPIRKSFTDIQSPEVQGMVSAVKEQKLKVFKQLTTLSDFP